MHGLENVRRREGNVSEGGGWAREKHKMGRVDSEGRGKISERRVGKGKNGGLFIAVGGQTVRRAMVHEWENVRRDRKTCRKRRVGEGEM